MQDLADIYGRSPRAVKRFVNCYRIFKSMLSVQGDSPYLPSDRSGFQPYELALLLLAIIVGSPAFAKQLVDAASETTNDGKPLFSFLKQPAPNASPEARLEWARLAPFVARFSNVTVIQSRDLVFRAWRFSFRTADSAAILRSHPSKPPARSAGDSA